MNCFRKLTLSGYMVKYVDLREAKPRTVCKEVYVIDDDLKRCLGELGIILTDYIRNRYEHSGYVCCSIERIKAKRQVDINLRELWEITAQAEPIREENQEAEEERKNE